MNKFFAGAFAGMLLLGTAHNAIAQEQVTIDGVEATRVVIAPPETDLARTIKAGLAASYYSAQPGTRSYEDAQKLYYFYGARHFEPLWLKTDAAGKVAWSDNARAIIGVFKDAYLTGLDPADYLTDALDLKATPTDPEALASLETAFSAAAIRYADDTHSGRLDPHSVADGITLHPDRLDDARTLVELASAPDPAAYLHGLEPQQPEFKALKAALAKFYDGTAKEPITVPSGRTLHLGMSDPRVPVMRDRLGLPASDDTIYDDALHAAVEDFQQSLGLTVDGVVGPATIAALNGGSATSKADIVANMERWRWEPRDMGNFRVMVNIPEFRLYVMDGETVAYTTKVVVGKTDHQTPIFSDEIEHVVVNPYWNVPPSIASDEIGPKLVSNPGYIARNNMELLYAGKVVDATMFDWSATNVNKFRIRQRPGAGNALGSVKFLFPNVHNVYLHDTPSKYLFDRSRRAFSHGCVRVQNPWDFATALLQHEPKLTVASLEAERGGQERWNNLSRHVPVHLTYFTLRVGTDGAIRSYGDIYGINARVKSMLGL